MADPSVPDSTAPSGPAPQDVQTQPSLLRRPPSPRLAAGFHSAEGIESPNTTVLRSLANHLRRHPSFMDELADSDRSPPALRRSHSPSKRGWRKTARRSFYVLVTAALVLLAVCTGKIASAERTRLAEQQRQFERLRYETQQGELRTVSKGALTLQCSLIVLNVILAVRGVQIWQLVKRFGVEEWIRQIHMSPLPATVRVASWLGRALRPLRLPFRPFAAIRAAQVAQAERAIAEAARLKHAASLQGKVMTAGAAAAAGAAHLSAGALSGLKEGARSAARSSFREASNLAMFWGAR